jgi:hypothetical protein
MSHVVVSNVTDSAGEIVARATVTWRLRPVVGQGAMDVRA